MIIQESHHTSLQHTFIEKTIQRTMKSLLIVLALLLATVVDLHVTNAFSILPAPTRTVTSLTSSTAQPETSQIVPPIPSNTGSTNDDTLIKLANEFIYTQSGFYSPAEPSKYSDQFVFRGPYIGPLNKKDYLLTMETFQIHKALPDISPNVFGFSVDPKDPNRVWFIVRNTGTFTGEPGLGLGFGQYFPPNGAKIEGCPETFSITFDEDKKVKLLTVGYVADRFEGNTGGKGAAIGIFNVVGLPVPPPGPLYSFITWFSNNVVGSPAKSCSAKEDVPKWWTNEERGADGYC